MVLLPGDDVGWVGLVVAVIMSGSIGSTMEKTFVVKLLNATEVRFRTGVEMRTMGHLRRAVEREVLLPPCFQRYSCMSQQYLEDTPDSLSLEVVLRGTKEGLVDGCIHERIVWLHWMAMTDCMVVGRGGLFLASELEQKRERMTRWPNSPPFQYVTLRQYLTLDGMSQQRRSQHRKRNRVRTEGSMAARRVEAGMRALSSDSEDEGYS